MKLHKHIVSLISVVLLTTTLLMPSAVQLAHAFEDHEHPVCEIQVQHLHEETPDCSLCDFQISVFHFDLPTEVHFTVYFNYKEQNSVLNSSFNNPSNRHYFLRGPPSFS